MATKRVLWIDSLRVIVVLLIFAFHSARVFDTAEQFYAKSATAAPWLTAFVGYLHLWQMPLLFLLAGTSSYFALSKRSGGQFLRERVLRLLVPFVFGVLVIVPPQGWYGARTNAGYQEGYSQFLSDYFTLKWGPISDYLGGPNFGHLWFIIHLCIISAVLLPVFLWLHGRGAGVATRAGGALASPWWWLLVAFVQLIAAGFPELFGHNPWIYGVWMLVGFLIAQDDAPVAFARRFRWWLLAVGSAAAVPVLLTYDVRERFPDPSVPIALSEYFVQLTAMILCFAAIGIAAQYLDRPWRGLPYLAEASYPTYILHQTVIVVLGFYLVRAVPAAWISWPVLTAASLGVTYAIYELAVRRWGVVRFLFGMKGKPRATA